METLLVDALERLSAVLKIKKPEALLQFLSARVHDLNNRFNKDMPPFATAFESLAPHPEYTSASALLIAKIEGRPYCLLGKRIRHKWYGDLGGKSDASDASLMDTAIREVEEESANTIRLSCHALRQSPSHDLISGTRACALLPSYAD